MCRVLRMMGLVPTTANSLVQSHLLHPLSHHHKVRLVHCDAQQASNSMSPLHLQLQLSLRLQAHPPTLCPQNWVIGVHQLHLPLYHHQHPASNNVLPPLLQSGFPVPWMESRFPPVLMESCPRDRSHVCLLCRRHLVLPLLHCKATAPLLALVRSPAMSAHLQFPARFSPAIRLRHPQFQTFLLHRHQGFLMQRLIKMCLRGFNHRAGNCMRNLEPSSRSLSGRRAALNCFPLHANPSTVRLVRHSRRVLLVGRPLKSPARPYTSTFRNRKVSLN